MPQLKQIADRAGMKTGIRDGSLVGHKVTVNRGSIRVRDVGDWDAGALEIPPGGWRSPDGLYRQFRSPGGVYQPAKVRFLGAPVYGYVATECVIDVEHSETATILDTSHFKGDYQGRPNASLRVPEKTVEILITNYASQQRVPLPWTLHYGWMFQTAGYEPKSLKGVELDQLEAFAQQYDKAAWDDEAPMFLKGDKKEWYPFPYRFIGPDAPTWLVPLGELDYTAPFDQQGNAQETRDRVGADPWDPVRCPMGDCSDGRC
jgi:hypothetical protein